MIRRRAGRRTFEDVAEKLNAVPDAGALDAGILREEQIAALTEGLRLLPEREREALRMKYYEHLSDADAAAILGIKPGAMRTLTYRARKLLREIMEEVYAQ